MKLSLNLDYKKPIPYKNFKFLPSLLYSFFFLLTFTSLCLGQKQSKQPKNEEIETTPSELLKIHEVSKSYRISDVVSCGLLDKDGVMWFGTNNEGLYRFDGKTFTNFSEQDGLCNNDINTIIEDRAGILWFGTPDGLCRYDKKVFTHVPIPWVDTSSIWLDEVYPIVNPNGVRSMLEDKNGIYWIGTNGAGAYRYDGKSFTSILSDVGRKQTDSLYHNIISSIIEDTVGNIWFTSMIHGGVSRYNGKSFSHFTLENGLSDDMITCSFKDSKGNIWFGSLGNRKGGLHQFDGNSFTNFNKTNGLSNNNITCIYEDNTGKLWIGSDRGSMNIFDGKTFTLFKTLEGQSFYRIHFILEDAIGNIWFGGNKGKLFRYDGVTLTDFTQKNTH